MMSRHARSAPPPLGGGAWSTSVFAVGQRQPQHHRPGYRCRRQHRHQRAGDLHAGDDGAVDRDHDPGRRRQHHQQGEAAAGVTISGTATAGSGAAINGQTATITIVDSSNVGQGHLYVDGDERRLVGERHGGAGPGPGRRQLQHQGQRLGCRRQCGADRDPGHHG